MLTAKYSDRIAALIVELSNDAVTLGVAEADRIARLERALQLLTVTNHSYLPGVFNAVIRACLAHNWLCDARRTYAQAEGAGVTVAAPLVAKLIGCTAPQFSRSLCSVEESGGAPASAVSLWA